MGKYPDSVNKYNHTPRKVFDSYTEKIERKLQQSRADARVLEGMMTDGFAAIHAALDAVEANVDHLLKATGTQRQRVDHDPEELE